jgi:hypothetical protein
MLRTSALSLARQLRDLIECAIVPVAIAILPYRIGLACARWCAWLPLYPEQVAGTAEGAAALGLAPDLRAFRRRRRLYVLLDHVDVYWSLWNDDAWILRHLRVEGRWPDDGRPFAVLFVHWGNGQFGIRHLTISGFRANMVLRPAQGEQFAGRPVQAWFARRRCAASERNGGAEVIFSGGARERIREVLRTPGRTVINAIDVPPTETHTLTAVNLLGRPTRLTHGLVQMAIDDGFRLVPMHVGLDRAARQRTLTIDPPIDPAGRSLEETMRQLADVASARITADPPAWWFWAWTAKFFA